MEKKINIAELLKDCPKGMELDCMMSENVFFDCVTDNPIYPIRLYVQSEKDSITLTSFGCTTPSPYAKCVIFPKGKTTWEGFHSPFKDGDIVVTKTSNNFIFYSIYKCVENRKVQTYVDYNLDNNKLMFNDTLSSLCFIDEIVEQRLATKEEKEELYNAIKANGYRWNAETKTLEKLITPKFKVGNIIQDKNGYKVRITDVDIEEEYYVYESLTVNGIGGISFNRQDEWELVPNKFDITTLKPFDKVLVRDNNEQLWVIDLFGFHDDRMVYKFMCVGHNVNQCIPYEGNQHLLGTTNDCDEFYKTWE